MSSGVFNELYVARVVSPNCFSFPWKSLFQRSYFEVAEKKQNCCLTVEVENKKTKGQEINMFCTILFHYARNVVFYTSVF